MNAIQIPNDLQPTLAYGPNVANSPTRGGPAEFTVCGVSPAEASGEDERQDRHVGPYRVRKKLGTGGMGEVFEAEHVLLGRRCAIKFIKFGPDAKRMALARFEQEVRATAKLTHWNTIEIYDYDRTDDGTFYYVMELLRGSNLGEVVKRHGPLPPERAVHFLSQVCNALREAHAIGLVHRDITPTNVFAAKCGEVYDVAKLLDFGLVKHAEAVTAQKPMMLSSGHFSGSPWYMSPEQAAAYEEADARSDVYSLGAVAYYLLTGSPPFAGNTPLQLISAHARDEVVAPSRVRRGIPRDLDQVVLRCLRKSAGDRYQDAKSLRWALDQCQCAGEWTEERAAAWWRAH